MSWKSNPLSASERRGILIVAAIALIITGLGVFLGNRSVSVSYKDIPGNEVMASDTVESKSKTTRKKGKSTNKKRSSKSKKKVYKRRNPLDEGV